VAANDIATAADATPRLPLRNECTGRIAPPIRESDKKYCAAHWISELVRWQQVARSRADHIPRSGRQIRLQPNSGA
jgi:hypothetical protein